MATTQPTINRDDLRARAATTAAAVEQARARMLENRAELRRRLEESLEGVEWEPAARRVKIRYWEAVRDGIGVLLAGPRGLVSALGALSRMVDDATDRGSLLAERGLTYTDRLPRSRAGRRRSRLRLVGWALGGFSLGFLLGWVLGSRPQPPPLDDPYDDVFPPTRLPEDVSNPNGETGRDADDTSPGEPSTSAGGASRGDAEEGRSDSNENLE